MSVDEALHRYSLIPRQDLFCSGAQPNRHFAPPEGRNDTLVQKLTPSRT